MKMFNFQAFFPVWYGYLGKTVGISEQQKREWESFKTQICLPSINRNVNGWSHWSDGTDPSINSHEISSKKCSDLYV